MLDIIDKDFKSSTFNMFKNLKETISKEIEQTMRMVSHQIENIYKEKNYNKRIK